MQHTYLHRLYCIGHYSTVTMDITQNTNSTVIKVKQEGVPIGEQDTTSQNWSNYYWAEIKRTFGYVGLVTTTTMSNDATSSQSPSSSDKKQKRRRRTDKKKKSASGAGAGAGVYTGAGLAVLTAFALGFWFSKK